MKTKLLLIFIFFLCLSHTYAQFTVGDSFNDGALTYKVENLSPLEASVTGFSSTTVTNLVIPSIASSGTQTFTVIGVGPKAFQASGVATVEFPTTLRFIEGFAFQGNGSTLISFNITNPPALNFIGGAVFAGCSSLQSADLSGISADLSTSNSMFNNCRSLTTFTMKNNTAVTAIPSTFLGTCSAMTTADFSGCSNISSFSTNVFRNNTSLTTLYLGSDTRPTLSFDTGAQTFAYVSKEGITSRDRTLYLPTNTGVSNFSNNNTWKSIFGNFKSQTPPAVGETFYYESLSYIVKNLDPSEVSVTGFSGATVTDLVIPSTVSNSDQNFTVVGIAESAFKEKSGLISVVFPTALRSIEDSAFQQTETLESFSITNPGALTALGSAIFEGCTDLYSVDLSNISADLSTSDRMFNNCTSLTSFKMNDNTAATLIPTSFLESCSTMITADFSGCSNITTISDNVFKNNTSLTILYLGTDIPPSLSTDSNVGSFANVNDADLTKTDRILYVATNTAASNYSNSSVWTDVFGSIQKIPAIGDTFNDGVLSYEIKSVNPAEASVTGFSGATIADLVIPSSALNSGQIYTVVGISESAFKEKSGLISLEFPTTLKTIDNTAFQQIETLESFTITNPKGLTALGRGVFEDCTSLQSADLSGISIDLSNSGSMFKNCTSLVSFTMNDNTAAAIIPPAFFQSCSVMTSVDFSGCSNITTISDNAFRNNTSLNKLILGTNIPPSVSTTFESETFGNINGGDLTKADRTLQVPTNFGVSNYSTIPIWTDIFETISYIPGPKLVTARPMIWVTNSEKQFIIDKINNNPWKTNYYNNFKNRVDGELSDYMADQQAYLSQLPFDTSNAETGKIPPFRTAISAEDRNIYKHYLKSGIDSGILYFLTGNEDYAKYSSSVFYTFIKAMNQVPLSTSASVNAGWLYQTDHLREARDIGAQIPVLYDFIASFLNDGGTAYDFAANIQVQIDWTEAEKIFKNYIFLAKNRGGIATNWPALESASLASNALALDSEEERNTELQYVINKRADRQIPLSVMSQKIQSSGGIWPEPFTYSKYVAEFSTYLMAVITKYDPSYDLITKFSNIPLSLPVANDFSYPNGNKTLHFGDGSRGYRQYYDAYEIAYYLGKLTNDNTLLDKFGKLINSGIDYNNYNREAFSSQRSTAIEPYFKEPLRLLWYTAEVDGESAVLKQSVTNELSFAGISLQRNIETPDPEVNGLMLFVGGAGFVHSYASGMNMELYGPNNVLGAAAGNTKNYTSTIHRNYYRLFAAHNTVIVNGASQGSGGIAGININPVKKLSIEPEYVELPVSPKNSFSTSSFRDNKGDKAESIQERTMAIVRTSPTSGYYVDVFKSNSSLPNEYHDYVYHNLSDDLVLESNGYNLSLTSDPTRYANGNTSGGFNNPGWQYFTDIETSGVYTGDVTASFKATRLGGGTINMKMHIPSEANREYTKVSAPPTLGVSGSYDNTRTPTVLIRHNGKAWDTPFTAVYEPYIGTNTNTVTNVTNIKRNGKFTGLEVESTIDGNKIKQIILIKDTDNSVFNDTALELELTGRFAILSLDENNELTSIYMGKGSHLKYKGWDITSISENPTSFYVDINGNTAEITTNSALSISYPSNIRITSNKLINNTLSTETNEFSNFSPNFVFYKTNTSAPRIWSLKTSHLDLSNVHLRVVNLLGITVMKKKIKTPLSQIDLSYISQGVYIIQLTKNNSIIDSKKVIISN